MDESILNLVLIKIIISSNLKKHFFEIRDAGCNYIHKTAHDCKSQAFSWLHMYIEMVTITLFINNNIQIIKKLVKILTPLVEVLLTKLINLCEETAEENAM